MEGLGLNRLFDSVYDGTRVLVTGHTGFKGSWLCLWLRAMGAQVSGLALSPNTEPSHWTLLGLTDVADHRIDLRDAAAVRDCLRSLQPQIVFHLAAQPLVRRSYADPADTFATNVTGVVNLFECLRGLEGLTAVVHATTDKVYRNPPADSGYDEGHPLGGHDPYSTSKACAELISECYQKCFFTGVDPLAARLATARAGNVIGGGDWSEDRLVPDLVRAATTGAPLLIRNPNAIRPWQHVLDALSGYLCLGKALLADDKKEGSWNFGPDANAAMSVRELAEQLRRHWPRVNVISAAGPHPHEADTLRLDSRKAHSELGWKPVLNLTTTIESTIHWYRAYYEHGYARSRDDLDAYVMAARDAGLEWAMLQ
jgi:CDP-glucose 4,6-dehydratase